MKNVLKLITLIAVNEIMAFYVNVSFIKDNHFNLITVNSVFIGFLFTSLSMLLGFLNEKVVQFFEEAGALKNVYNNIQKGIVISLGSVVTSILDLTVIEKYITNKIIINSCYSLELLFLIITLYYLLFTIRELKTVVDSIRINKIKTKKSDEANEELEKLFNEDIK